MRLIKTIIVDASPLIVLLKSGLDFVLPAIFDRVLVTEAVRNEVLAGPPNDKATLLFPSVSYLEIVSDELADRGVDRYRLGIGETQTLLKARLTPNSAVLIDDSAARKCARDLSIEFLGTGRLLVTAKKRDLIDSFATAMDMVQDAGLWVGSDVRNLLTNMADERD